MPRVLLTTSCTHALEMAATASRLRPGRRSHCPFLYLCLHGERVRSARRADRVFADIRPDTLNLDETQLESSDHAPHQGHRAGALCRASPARWMRSARSRNDTACASWKTTRTACSRATRANSRARSAALATQSFHETKNITCGEGGALLVNDPELVERALIIREKGTNRSQFFRGQVDKYTWVDIGSSYLPSDLLAAFLLAQLEGQCEIQQQAPAHLGVLPAPAAGTGRRKRGVRLPCDSRGLRAGLSHVLSGPAFAGISAGADCAFEGAGILSVFHYVPLHLSDMGQSLRPESAIVRSPRISVRVCFACLSTTT